jgi:hypothetical protein
VLKINDDPLLVTLLQYWTTVSEEGLLPDGRVPPRPSHRKGSASRQTPQGPTKAGKDALQKSAMSVGAECRLWWSNGLDAKERAKYYKIRKGIWRQTALKL